MFMPDELASPRLSYRSHLAGQIALVTGTTLFVDGGMTLYPGFEDNG